VRKPKAGERRKRRGSGPRRQERPEFGTLGAALSAAEKQDLGNLRERLVRRVSEVVEAQRARRRHETPPWHAELQTRRSIAGQTARTQRGWRGGHGSRPRDVSKARTTEYESHATGVFGPQRSPVPERTSRRVGFQFWTLPSGFRVSERPPSETSKPDRARFDEIARAASVGPQGGDLLFLTIGLDFGTSSTKVIVRMPYESTEPAIAIPAPEHCRSGGHPYLWRTAVWLDESGSFKAYAGGSSVLVDDLKWGMIERRTRECVVRESSPTTERVTRIDAATAYVAYVIRYTEGWLLRNRERLFRGRAPVWFVNIGVPASNYDDQELFAEYRLSAAAAFSLAHSHEAVCADTVKTFLRNEDVKKAAGFAEAAADLGVAIIPEVAAGATGFAKSDESTTGLYLMADVGAATLDVCMFRLHKNLTEPDRYLLLETHVQALGVEAYHSFRKEGRTDRGFAEQCDRCLREVIWKAKLNRDPKNFCWRPGGDLPVFLLGGGAGHRLHRAVVESLDPWLKQHAGSQGIRLVSSPTPECDLPEPVDDDWFDRMAVAWGLSFPPTDAGGIEPGSKIRDIPGPASKDWRSFFPSKDAAQ